MDQGASAGVSSNLEYSKQRTTRRRSINRELIYIYKMIYLHSDLPVGHSRIHHIHHDIHDIHLSNIWLPERNFVKYWTLLRLKTCFLSRWNPAKSDPKLPSGNTLSNALRHLNFFFAARNFSLWRPRGPTRSISVPCFCSLFAQATTAVTSCSLLMFP